MVLKTAEVVQGGCSSRIYCGAAISTSFLQSKNHSAMCAIISAHVYTVSVQAALRGRLKKPHIHDGLLVLPETNT